MVDPGEQSGTHPGTGAVTAGMEGTQVQKDYGDRNLAHMEREQVCDMGDAMH